MEEYCERCGFIVDHCRCEEEGNEDELDFDV